MKIILAALVLAVVGIVVFLIKNKKKKTVKAYVPYISGFTVEAARSMVQDGKDYTFDQSKKKALSPIVKGWILEQVPSPGGDGIIVEPIYIRKKMGLDWVNISIIQDTMDYSFFRCYGLLNAPEGKFVNEDPLSGENYFHYSYFIADFKKDNEGNTYFDYEQSIGIKRVVEGEVEYETIGVIRMLGVPYNIDEMQNFRYDNSTGGTVEICLYAFDGSKEEIHQSTDCDVNNGSEDFGLSAIDIINCSRTGVKAGVKADFATEEKYDNVYINYNRRQRDDLFHAPVLAICIVKVANGRATPEEEIFSLNTIQGYFNEDDSYCSDSFTAGPVTDILPFNY